MRQQLASLAILAALTACGGGAGNQGASDPSTLPAAVLQVQALPSAIESSTTASPVAAKAVDLTDAIAILKMIVGLDVNTGGAALTAYQAYAADVDGNGKVELSDAISVLKRIVGLETATANWMFFNGTPTVADKLNPGLPPTVSAAVSSTNSVSMTAVLRGDVVSSSAFTYSWALTTVPAGSTATLASATAANPSFKADLAGAYVATMTITDGSKNVATSTVTLSACDSGSPTSNPLATCVSNSTNSSVNLNPILISQYKNEIGSSQVFNSAIADLNGDGLDDIVLSGWAVAQDTYVGSRSGFVYLKIFIQQSNGSLVDKTNELIGDANSSIWGSQRVLINDYDNDGRPDIAVLGFQDGPKSTFAPSAIFWNNGNSFLRSDLLDKLSAHAACAGDLNGDGLPELIAGAADVYPNTIYSNLGSRQFKINHDLTKQQISSGGACAVLKDQSTGNTAIVTTNLPLYPFFSAVVNVWDKNFNFIKANGLLGSDESGTNIAILHDIVNVIPIDINGDGKTDLVITDNGNFRLNYANGSMSVLINEGDFSFKNETDKYLADQSKTSFFNYYHSRLTIDGYQAIYLDNGGLGVSLWQIRDGKFIKYKEELLNSITKGYQYTNIYKTKNGYSLFLIGPADYPYTAAFSYRPIPNN